MIKLIKKIRKKDLWLIFIAIALIVCQVWLDLKMPDYMSKITRLVQTEGSKMLDILKNGGYMLLCAFGSLFAASVNGYIFARIASNFSMDMRGLLFSKVGSFSTAEIKKFSTSSLITRTTNDVTQIEMILSMGLQLFIKAPITAVWAITKILNKSWQWSALTGVGVIILLSTIGIIISMVLPKFKIVQKLTDRINGITRENLTGIRVVRAFNAEEYQEEKFNDVNEELTKTQLFNQKAFAFLQPIMYLVMYFLTLGIYFIGAYLIDNALMSDKISLFGDMIVFSSYGMQVIMSFLMLAIIFTVLPRAQVSANRINEVLDEKNSILDGKFDISNLNEKGTIEFKNVSFKYPDADENILENISFKASRGETVAFIGSTGSGKSTLINLVLRFYDVTKGEILIDGINIKEYKLEDLNNRLGYVPQKAIMFAGTVKSNINYGNNGKNRNELQIKEAIKIAQAEDFVLKMEDQYNAHIAQSGTNISGGQKQRLSIARAIAKDPEIYIFDDCFSALDYKTDLTLRKELKKYTADVTCLIVAQRIGTIMNADKIIVLEHGKCVGIGTHKELLKNCEVYHQIAFSQLSKEELDNA